MRGLAEFVMRGRWQALAVAVLGSGTLLFGWLGAATVALVTLRKGLLDGGWLVLWAALPALVVTWISGDAGSLLLLVGTFLLAVILRTSVSLALAMVASVPIGLASGGSLLLFSAEFLGELVAVFTTVIAELEAGMAAPSTDAVELLRPTPLLLAGMLGAGTAFTAVLSLLLARYWQALLYNPGGFGEEFRALRLPVALAVALVLAAVVVRSYGIEAMGWAVLITLPLTVWGFALVHARARYRGQGAGWLTAVYFMWVLFDPVKWALILFAVADGFMDFRSRWNGGGDRDAD